MVATLKADKSCPFSYGELLGVAAVVPAAEGQKAEVHLPYPWQKWLRARLDDEKRGSTSKGPSLTLWHSSPAQP